MTQEEKDLLLKDLCARLPYGVKIVIQDTFKYSIVSREYHVLDVSNFSDIFCFNYKKFDKRMKKVMRERPNDIVIKPYLFPLSSMTEELIEELNAYGFFKYRDTITNVSHLISNNGINEEIYTYIDIEGVSFLIEFFNSHHIDYRGLIEKELAIDATGLNIY